MSRFDMEDGLWSFCISSSPFDGLPQSKASFDSVTTPFDFHNLSFLRDKSDASAYMLNCDCGCQFMRDKTTTVNTLSEKVQNANYLVQSNSDSEEHCGSKKSKFCSAQSSKTQFKHSRPLTSQSLRWGMLHCLVMFPCWIIVTTRSRLAPHDNFAIIITT